jgi:CheY-like chemotaxis protein
MPAGHGLRTTGYHAGSFLGTDREDRRLVSGERIRVFIAGNIYVKRAQVRRFLEDDGYEVVGEARTREDAVADVRRDQPDAIVIDDDLLAEGPGGGTMGRLRRAAPDAKVVVFTSSVLDAAPAPEGADGHLEKGLGLASLTAMLGRLFAEEASAFVTTEMVPIAAAGVAETVPLAPVPSLDEDEGEEDGAAVVPLLVGTGVAAGAVGTTQVAAAPVEGTSGGALAASAASSAGAPGGANVPRIVAIVSGAVLIVWGLAAMFVGGAPTPAPAQRADADGAVVASPSPSPDAQTPLDAAYGTLDDMVVALRSGNYVLATVDARTLMDQRAAAFDAGFALVGIDAEITARLDPLANGLPPRVSAALLDVLGDLYPDVGAPAEPGGGSDVVLETAPATSTSSTVTTTEPLSPPTQDENPTPSTTDAPPSEPAPQPGDGRVWGQSHHPDGGWHGEHGNPHGDRQGHGKPPWAGP